MYLKKIISNCFFLVSMLCGKKNIFHKNARLIFNYLSNPNNIYFMNLDMSIGI